MNKLRKQLCESLEARLQGRDHPVPAVGGELFSAFLALSRARSSGPNGPNPISWHDLLAWSHLMRMPIEPHHAETIMALDAIWMAQAASPRSQTPDGVKILPKMSQHPLSAAVFDVVTG